MAAHEPASLTVGTEVSAKYKGAFCEAKIKKVVKSVKVKVTLKDSGAHIVVLDDDIRLGVIKIGAIVEVRHPESGQIVPGCVNKITDSSMYTVVFDDGDENTLRRTQLCLKGEKHFVKTDTLDELPLTHPEHFGTPVVKGSKSKRRSPGANVDSESDEDSSDDEEPEKRRYRGRIAELVGKVLVMEIEDRKKTAWIPVLVVQPSADDTDLKTKDHLLVKSFKDSKFYTVLRRDTREFTREMSLRNDDRTLKGAFDKATLYFDAKELPNSWDRDDLLGTDSEDEDDEESSDDEQNEEKDRFVAQLYKFMDDRGTPLNKGPTVGNKDLNLYRLFRVVQNLGGYNRVTNQIKWKLVYAKMSLAPSTTGANQIKSAYKKYLHAFEDFYRKLGSTMGTISRPARSRQSNRSIMSFRERDSSSKSPARSRKGRDDDDDDTASTKSEEKSIPAKTIKTRSKVVTAEPPQEKSEKAESETEEDTPRKTRTRGDRNKTVEITTPKAMREDPLHKIKEEKPEPIPPKVDAKKDKEEKKVLKEEPHDSDSDEEKDSNLPRKRRRKRSLRVLEEEETQKEEAKLKSKRGNKKATEKEAASETSETPQVDKEEEVPEEPKKTIKKEKPVPEYSPGTKLRVKYGKGKTQKLYIAKVVEAEEDGASFTYLVHYAGWNTRYDEWVKKDRIVGRVEEKKSPNKGKPAAPTQAQSTKKVVKPPTAKTPPVPTEKPISSRAVGGATPAGKPRPTRSNSMEVSLAVGLPSKTLKKRVRRTSGFTESSKVSDESDSDEDQGTGPPEDMEDNSSVHGSSNGGPPDIVDSDDSSIDVVKDAKEATNEIEPKVTRKPLFSDDRDSESESAPQLAKSSSLVSSDKLSKDTEAPELEKEISSEIPALKLEVGSESPRSIPESKLVDIEKPVASPEVRTPKRQLGKRKRKASLSVDSIPVVAAVETVVEAETSQNVSGEVIETKEAKSSPAPKVPKTADKPKASDKKLPPTVTECSVQIESVPASVMEAKLQEVEKEAKESPQPVVVQDIKEDTGRGKKKIKAATPAKENEKETTKVDAVEAIPETPVTKPGRGRPKRSTAEPKIDKAEEVKPKSPPREPSPVVPIIKEEEEVHSASATESEPPKEKPKAKGKGKKKAAAAAVVVEDTQAESNTDSTSEVTEKKRPGRRKKKKVEEPEEIKTEPIDIPEVTPECSTSQKSPVKSEETSKDESSPSASSAPQLTATDQMDPQELPEDDQAPRLSPIPKSVAQALLDMGCRDHVDRDNAARTSMEAAGAMMQNTPPDTPDRSPPHVAPPQELSPGSSQDIDSTRSDQEANMEVAAFMAGAAASRSAALAESLAEENSATSSNSLTSINNVQGSETESSVITTKRKSEPEEQPPVKRRKRGHKRLSEKKAKSTPKHSMSDSDEHDLKEPALKDKKGDTQRGPRKSKYNFLDLEEAKDLEGEKRIDFLMGRIQDLRKVYLHIKSELALLDRRRKRMRRKVRAANQPVIHGDTTVGQ